MKRVTGIGGIFFKAKDPLALREWYREHLGIDVEDWGGTAFRWATPDVSVYRTIPPPISPIGSVSRRGGR